MQVFDPEEQIDMIDDKYWDVRAEAYDEEEERLSEGDRLIHVYHIAVSENNHVSNAAKVSFYPMSTPRHRSASDWIRG